MQTIKGVMQIGLALLICLVSAAAQEPHQHEHMATEQIGQVRFPTSCKPSVRQPFERAVAMLHSFWYEESEKAFTAISEQDPGCAMAYWGLSMSLYHQLWEPPITAAGLKQGAAAIEKAKSIGAQSEREQSYLEALELYYKDADKLDHHARAVAYEKAMARVYLRYPEDHEAAVFYALALIASALPTDKTYANQKQAATILDAVYKKVPNHPGVAHYFIHAYDSPPLAHLALNAARAYAKIAPSAPHALHMPSHIFTRLGLWQESIQSNIVSAGAAKDYAIKTQMSGTWDEQLHAMDYLEYAYLQSGQDAAAGRVLDELNTIQRTNAENMKVAYAFAAIPARYALERRRWSDAAALGLRPASLSWNRFAWAEATLYFARAMGAARSGDAASARKDYDRLDALHQRLVAAKDNYWSNQIEILRLEAAAWMAQANGNRDEALKLMRAAATLEDSTEKHPVTPGAIIPAREMLGDLLLEVREPRAALLEFESSLGNAPNRFNGLYGAARAAALSGDQEKAKAFYGKLVAACARADSSRPELQEAKAFLAKK